MFAVAVIVVTGALVTFNAVALTADEATARQLLTIVDSGSTDGLEDIYAPTATSVDYNGVVHQGIDQIKLAIAGDQAAATSIDSIGHPTTIGSIVSTPHTWSNSLGSAGHGVFVSTFADGLIVYSTVVIDGE